MSEVVLKCVKSYKEALRHARILKQKGVLWAETAVDDLWHESLDTLKIPIENNLTNQNDKPTLFKLYCHLVNIKRAFENENEHKFLDKILQYIDRLDIHSLNYINSLYKCVSKSSGNENYMSTNNDLYKLSNKFFMAKLCLDISMLLLSPYNFKDNFKFIIRFTSILGDENIPLDFNYNMWNNMNNYLLSYDKSKCIRNSFYNENDEKKYEKHEGNFSDDNYYQKVLYESFLETFNVNVELDKLFLDNLFDL